MAVAPGMSSRQNARLEADERSIQRHRDWLEEHEAAMRELDRKLDRLADLQLRNRSGDSQN